MNIFAVVALQPYFAPIWIMWGVMFLVVELTAIFARWNKPDPNKDGGTLSEFIWRCIRGPHWYNHVGWFVVAGGLAVLFYHFLFQPLH